MPTTNCASLGIESCWCNATTTTTSLTRRVALHQSVRSAHRDKVLWSRGRIAFSDIQVWLYRIRSLTQRGHSSCCCIWHAVLLPSDTFWPSSCALGRHPWCPADRFQSNSDAGSALSPSTIHGVCVCVYHSCILMFVTLLIFVGICLGGITHTQRERERQTDRQTYY